MHRSFWSGKGDWMLKSWKLDALRSRHWLLGRNQGLKPQVRALREKKLCMTVSDPCIDALCCIELEFLVCDLYMSFMLFKAHPSGKEHEGLATLELQLVLSYKSLEAMQD